MGGSTVIKNTHKKYIVPHPRLEVLVYYDTLEYSEPQLVNGGMAPPPCRGLPGTVCYMVIEADYI